MDDLNALVQEAIAAVKAGRKQEGRDKLLAVIERNDRHEQAWLGLSALVETTEERLICLENVLAINPDNERAKNALAKLGGQAPAPLAPPVQPPTAAPSAVPPADAPPDPFGGASFEPFDPYPATPFNDEFGGSLGEDDSPFGDLDTSGASNVEDDIPDWYRSVSSQPSAQDTDGPPAEHYDQWVEQLNLNPGTDDALEGTFGDAPFGGDSPFGAAPALWDDPSLDEDFSTPDAPWSAAGSPFDDVNENEVFDPFRGAPARGQQPASSPPSPSLSGSAFSFDSAPGDAEEDEDEAFSFDFDDDPVPATPATTDGWLAQASASAPSAPLTGKNLEAAQPVVNPVAMDALASARSANMQAYFQQIPADIEAVPPSRWSRQRIMLISGIVVLLVLNIVSLGLLVTTL